MTMSIRKEMALAALLALGLLAFAFAAHAGAKGKYKQATFKAEIKGVQTYENRYDHTSTNRCDPEIHNATNETWRFASRRPMKVTVTRIPGMANGELYFTSGEKPLWFKARSTVRRGNTHSYVAPPKDCGDNGGGVPPGPGPDCGTRKVNLLFGIDYYKRGHLELQPQDNAGSDLFERCDRGAYPFLLSGETFGKRQSAELPERDVFNKKYGKIIVVGRGSRSIPYPEGLEETKIRWELSLTRVKHRR
jgi:hypothetical protein